MNPHTKIGCEAYIVRDGQILLGKRGNVHGKGTWALPGGHLNYQERADACIIRELGEEMGLKIRPAEVKLLAVTDDLNPEAGSHYIHITFAVNIAGQTPEIMEPDACDEWKWFDTDHLPTPFFPPHQKILTTIASSRIYVA